MAKKITITNDIEEFVNYMETVVGSPQNTISSYKRDLRQMSEYLAAEHQIETVKAVTADHLNAYIDYLNDREKAPSTISRVVASMKRFFGYCLVNDKLIANPACDLHPPKLSKHTPEILTDEEMLRIKDQIKKIGKKGMRDQAMLDLMSATGMHVSEVVSLSIDDVDLKKKKVHLVWNNKERVLDINQTAADSLKKYIKESRPIYLNSQSGDLMFMNSHGKQLSRQGFWKMLKNYATAAGIEKDITPHTIRHTVVSKMFAEGVDLQTIKEQLGYADISTAHMYNALYKKSLEENK